jgi:hypothetical protein
MRNPWHVVNGPPQPPLFAIPAVAITLQACIDRDNGSVVFGVQAVDPINDQLVALWSSSAVPEDRYLKTMHEAHREWLELLWEHTGPF